jgi:hypothetical protein
VTQTNETNKEAPQTRLSPGAAGLREAKCNPECPGNDSCPHNEVCMCGDYMKDHDNGMWSGHSPVSMHDYYSRRTDS